MQRILVIGIYFHYTPYMFRTILVHLQEQSFYKLYIAFSISRYHTSGCCVTIATSVVSCVVIVCDFTE